MKRAIWICLLALLAVRPAWAQGTITPTPYQIVMSGTPLVPVSGAKVCTYLAGTSTPTFTYTDATLSTPNSNPIITTAAGRYTAWLSPALSYKYVFYSNDGTPNTCDGTLLNTVDGISVAPGGATLNITGLFGDTVTAGQAVYLSDGSGAKASGSWFKADSANAYSATTSQVGLAPSAVTAGQQGTIRLQGSVSGLSGLAIGGKYYVGTAGAVTLTPTGNVRVVGQADTTTTMVVGPLPSPAAGIPCGRVTLTTGVPVTVADVTAATSVFFTPTGCNQVTLWNGSAVVSDTLTEQTLAVPATTSTLYDVFAFDNAGAVNIELLAWTNDATRATALVFQNGFLVKSGAPTRRYVGQFRTTTVSGQTEDSATKRYVWNMYNRVRRPLRVADVATSWNYSTAAWRQANANAANQVDVIVGVADALLDLRMFGLVTNTNAGWQAGQAIGEDGTSLPAVGLIYGTASGLGGVASAYVTTTAMLEKYPAVGRHFYPWIEFSVTAATTTFLGTNATAILTTGLVGWIEG